MRYSKCAEIDGMVRQLVRSGWSFRRGSKHGRVTSPDGKASLIVPTSPSDWRSPHNFARDLRKTGAVHEV